jgi:hypothetical protein
MPSPRKRPASPNAPSAPNAEILTALGRIEALLTRIADRLDHVPSSGGLPEDASRQLERGSRNDQPGLGAQERTTDAAAAAAKAVASAVASAAARSAAPASQLVRQPARLPTAQRAR